VHEYGIEQQVRDARIAMIYEGTNEVQAIDLLQRKVLADGGATLFALLEECEAEAGRAAPEFAAPLREACASARAITSTLIDNAKTDRELALRAADDFLFGLAHTLLAWAFAASARAAAAEPDAAWAQAKTARMRYGMQWLLPQGEMHWSRVAAARKLALPAVQ
jgi:Acetyl-CoA dehydrogenase C-terminal like/Acyl-CoA dehydrogenase, C-terminal domain